MKKNYVFGGIGGASLALREACDWTQSELASRVGCSFGTVSRWERHPEETMVVRKAFANKFMALYKRNIKRNRRALSAIEVDELELIQGELRA